MSEYTDTAYSDAAAFLEEKFSIDLGREKREVSVDQLGYGRWLHDYIRERDKGSSHELALFTINERINSIVGLPAGTSPRPFQPSPLKGDLKIENGIFTINTEPHLPLICHFGEAFSCFVRNPEKVIEQLRKIKDAGYDAIRFWDNLGYYPSWTGREVTPYDFINKEGNLIRKTADYYNKLKSFISSAKEIGLALVHSRGDYNALNKANLYIHMDKVFDIYNEIGFDVLWAMEGNNEDWQNGNFGPTTLREAVRKFGEKGKLTILSCPPDSSEEKEELKKYITTFFYLHGSRNGEYHDIIRHIFSVKYESFPNTLGWQGEPSGPGDGVTVGQVNSPHALKLMAAMSFMCGQAWTYMSSNGVFFNGPIEKQVGFYEVSDIRNKLPKDLMKFTKLVHGGASQRGNRVFAVPGTDETRADHAFHSDGRFMCIIYGPRWKEVYQERNAYISEIIPCGDVGQIVFGRI